MALTNDDNPCKEYAGPDKFLCKILEALNKQNPFVVNESFDQSGLNESGVYPVTSTVSTGVMKLRILNKNDTNSISLQIGDLTIEIAPNGEFNEYVNYETTLIFTGTGLSFDGFIAIPKA